MGSVLNLLSPALLELVLICDAYTVNINSVPRQSKYFVPHLILAIRVVVTKTRQLVCIHVPECLIVDPASHRPTVVPITILLKLPQIQTNMLMN